MKDTHMKLRCASVCAAGLVLLATACPLVGLAQQTLVGGYSAASVTEPEVMRAVAFAIKAKQKKGPKLLLVKILSAQQQVVAGLNYRLELRVKLNNKLKNAEAVVYQNLSGEHKLTSWIWKSP
jgi:hypothetical protein